MHSQAENSVETSLDIKGSFREVKPYSRIAFKKAPRVRSAQSVRP
jgi:hypothetical protein